MLGFTASEGVTVSVPYAYIEAGWFIGGAALIGAGLGLIWKLVHP